MPSSDPQMLKIFRSAGWKSNLFLPPTESKKKNRATIGFDSAARGAIQPALEVDHFVWPPLCKALIDSAGTIGIPLIDAICQAADSESRVILLSGGARQSGRTTTALWLAAALTERQRRVVLVDADIEQPCVAEHLGIQPFSGWQQFATDGHALAEYLIESVTDRFTVLPCTVKERPKQWPNHWDLASILESLRDHFDVVLVDAMPLEKIGLGREMLRDCGPFIDTALWLDTDPTDTLWAQAQLQATGIRLLGLIQRAQRTARAA